MPLTGSCGCLKRIVVLVNLIFFLVGLGISLLTLWLYALLKQEGTLSILVSAHSVYGIAFLLAMFIGFAMTVLGFLGCCGAWKESQCLLTSFFLLILAILAVQVWGVVWSFLNPQTFHSVVEESMKTAIQESYAEVVPLREAVDTLQQQFHCCGAKGPYDWADSTYNTHVGSDFPLEAFVKKSAGRKSYRVPKSCCGTKECRETNGVEVAEALAIYDKGCVDAAVKHFQELHPILFLGAVGVFSLMVVLLLIEILAMACAVQLCCAIRRDDYTSVYVYNAYDTGIPLYNRK